MRTVAFAMLTALGAALFGAVLGWGVWVMRGQPQAQAPALALMQPMPGATDAAVRDPRRVGGRMVRAPDGAPRLAIVIDDIGQSVTQVDDFLALGVPITFSILPDLAHTRGSAQHIVQARREYIIHLPMQPENYPFRNPGPSPMLLDQSPQETQRLLQGYIAELPDAVGASNHMGSAYTGDEAHMALVQAELAKHQLFFLNSKTNASPVPGRIAAHAGYPYLSRDVFLDNVRDVALIERQITKAVQRARDRGYAIAIGHPYGETLTALNNALARGDLAGVELIQLSELMR